MTLVVAKLSTNLFVGTDTASNDGASYGIFSDSWNCRPGTDFGYGSAIIDMCTARYMAQGYGDGSGFGTGSGKKTGCDCSGGAMNKYGFGRNNASVS